MNSDFLFSSRISPTTSGKKMPLSSAASVRSSHSPVSIVTDPCYIPAYVSPFAKIALRLVLEGRIALAPYVELHALEEAPSILQPLARHALRRRVILQPSHNKGKH